ncbi:DUF7667 family protein [Paenibacillus senegalensis]|uniref:DUF7667 family protein n=1 Tax=Paenibacillus senegalensis TaxID=1465766 RepID=UPI0002883CAC|nr:hypothetical protein [Paenibacillus senegalensis]
MIGIHPVHRKLAEIAYMSTDKHGNLIIGWTELQLIMPLLRRNLELVRRLDELKELAFTVQCAGQDEWVQDICKQIEELVAELAI